MTTNIENIYDGELPRSLSGLGQTSTGKVFDDGTGTVMSLFQGVKAPRQVKQMQMLLNTFGYKLTADGVFGAGTAAAVKAVQQKFSMSPTGVYDKALDARITGMNQSGIIDATPADVKAVATGQTQTGGAGGTTTSTGGNLNITPVVPLVPGPMAPAVQAGVTTSFVDKMKAKWTALRADPNFKYYAAAAGTVLVGVVVLPSLLKPSPAPQMQGIHRRARKHSRR